MARKKKRIKEPNRHLCKEIKNIDIDLPLTWNDAG